MNNKCLYCESTFNAKRSTRKYCSDNCKQLAYFKRNGMVFGVNGANPEQGNIKSVIVTPREKDSVKYGSLYDTPLLTQNTIPKVLLCNHVPFITKKESEDNVKDETLIVKPNVKYDSETLSQNTEIIEGENEVPFTVSNNKTTPPKTLSVMEIEGNEESDKLKDKYIKDLEEKLKAITFQTEQEQKESQKDHEEKLEYEWVYSTFLKEIENDFEVSNGQDFWDSGNPDVDWVNVSLRCVIENLIRLSQYDKIGRHDLLSLNNALASIVNSHAFTNLPSDYPFLKITWELAERMDTLASNTTSNEVPLRISLKTKAKLVSMVYQMKDNVPLIKFNELEFKEPPKRQMWEISGSWKERHRYYVEQGILDPDDSDSQEDESENEEIEYRRKSDNPYCDRMKHFEKTGKFPKKAA